MIPARNQAESSAWQRVEISDIYKSVPRLAASESVVVRIEQLIVGQQLKPGDLLPPERELAVRLSVSRNVLREALRSLSQKGLISVEPGRGTFVLEPSSDTVRESLALLLQLGQVRLSELCDVRALIEPEMAARASERASPEDHVRLARWMANLEDSAEDAAAHVEADIGFHRAIAHAAAHPVFMAIADAVSVPVVRSMLIGTKVPRAIDESDEHHRQIFAAIASRDPDASRAAMRTHNEYVRVYILECEEAGV
jgi:GntR family transcriptional repressor for pyruvate dehydrogenase complex